MARRRCQIRARSPTISHFVSHYLLSPSLSILFSTSPARPLLGLTPNDGQISPSASLGNLLLISPSLALPLSFSSASRRSFSSASANVHILPQTIYAELSLHQRSYTAVEPSLIPTDDMHTQVATRPPIKDPTASLLSSSPRLLSRVTVKFSSPARPRIFS